MAIKYQFNKTSLNDLNKQLKVRERALPTIKNKEAALRLEVKKAKQRAEALSGELEKKLADYSHMAALWHEFDPELVVVEKVSLTIKRLSGIKIPELQEVHFSVKPYSLFMDPLWYFDGITLLQELSRLGIEREVWLERMRVLDYARKKTTQKVNLYEKVQIPGYSEAIRKIKRFLEDEENLSKSSQKIVKKRQEEVE